jgi:hypothetical protein
VPNSQMAAGAHYCPGKIYRVVLKVLQCLGFTDKTLSAGLIFRTLQHV